MASNYPSGLDTFSTAHVDSVGEIIHAIDINNLADAVDKIEAELGLLPKGTFPSVASKLGSLYYGTISDPNALTAGNRPKGLIVFNTTNNRYEFNSGTDAAPSWSPVGPAGPWGPNDLTSSVSVIPVGGVIEWPWSSGTIPSWAALPAGQALSRTTYAVLFALANSTGLTVYGAGDGTTTFAIPDMRGRVSVGKDDMGGTTAGRITAAVSGVAGTTLGAVFGAEGITLTTAQLPAHNHTITGSPTLSGAPTLTGAPTLSGAPALAGSPTLTGAPGKTDPGHTHGGLTGTENQNHVHTGTTDGDSPDHSHAQEDGQDAGGGAGGYKTWDALGFSANGSWGLSGNTLGANTRHTHTFTSNAENAAHNHNIPSGTTGITVTAGTLAVGIGTLSVNNGSLAVSAGTLATGVGTLAVSAGTLATANAGSGTVHQNTQPSIVVNKIMRVT